jgi:hypothetical protein
MVSLLEDMLSNRQFRVFVEDKSSKFRFLNLKAQYCHQSYLIYIQVIYPQQIPENSFMLTT